MNNKTPEELMQVAQYDLDIIMSQDVPPLLSPGTDPGVMATVIDANYVNYYQKEAMATAVQGMDESNMLIEAAMGLAGESGEVIDIVKKMCFQGHELDKEHLILELGDVMWYLAEAATAIGVDLSYILRKNLEKITNRYPDGFNPSDSINREEGDI